MNFPMVFCRFVGGAPPGGVALGSDVAPTTLSLPLQADYKRASNVFTARAHNTSGFPVQRVAIGIAYDGAGVPTSVPISSYIWDDKTARWYKIQTVSAVTIDINSISWVDVPALLDFPNVSANGGLAPVGALEIAIVAGLPATHPDGCYTFVVGADVSNPGV